MPWGWVYSAADVPAQARPRGSFRPGAGLGSADEPPGGGTAQVRALLSVANRDGLTAFARDLQRLGVELYATDGTREHLAADGIEVASVSDLTAVPSLVGGQVRTFHPAIYAGILARRDIPEQLDQLTEHGIGLIDLVVVNVKPFAPEVGRGHIAHRRGDRDDRRRRGRAPGRRRPERGGRRRGLRPGPLPAGRRGARVARPRQRGDALPARGRRVQHRRRLLRRDRGLLQPDLEQRLPAAARARAREGDRAAVRREPAPARGVLPRDDPPQRDDRGLHPAPGRAADVQQPAGPRRRLPDRGRLHGADGGHHQAHRPGRDRVRRRSWSTPTSARSTPTPCRRSAASSASTASSTARPLPRSPRTRTRR